MSVHFEGRSALDTAVDITKINVDGYYLLKDSVAYSGIPISGRSYHLDVKSFDAGNQQIEQTLTDQTNGFVYKRIIYNSSAHTAPLGNSSVGVDWYVLHGVGKPYGADFVSDANNTRSLGRSDNAWSNVFSNNAVTVTSDRNAKNSIQDIDDVVLQAWSEVKPKQYKLNGDDKWSFGYIAQDIVEAFTRHGLDYKQYNIVHEQDGKFMLKYDMCHLLDRALMRP